nr:hypothetical protein BaRGS_022102 [Batillaria attramentaria]
MPAFLRYWAQKTPNTAAFIFRAPNSDKRHVLTYSDLYRLAGRWASVLHDKGLGRGDFVVNALPNSPERAVVECSILLSGATSVNGMCQLRDASDLLSTLRQSRAAALVLDPDVMGATWSSLSAYLTGPEDGSGAVTSDELPSLKFVFLVRRSGPKYCRCRDSAPGKVNTHKECAPSCSNSKPLDEADFLTSLQTSSHLGHFHAENITGQDLCSVFTTSGTTGFSKLVPFCHKALTAFSKSTNSKATTEFCCSPLGWMGGYPAHIFSIGSTRVLLDAREGQPEDMDAFIYDSIVQEKAKDGVIPFTHLQGVAERVIHSHSGEPILENVILATQPVTKDILETAVKIARNAIVCYGSTETNIVSLAAFDNQQTYEDFLSGPVLPHASVKIRNESGADLDACERGEIVVKSPLVLAGYVNDPDVTSAAFTDDGYFRTGDVGWLDSQGRLFVEGRGSDAIMRGSYIFYPGWMEARIRAGPGVSDVMVVGVPDPVLNQELCACVVLNSPDASVDDVRAFVEDDVTGDDSLSPRPRHYVTFDRFPVTATGKPMRKEAARIATERICSLR